MPLQQGDRIGDYEILDVLGKGGMGQVYKVRNVISERCEAMKILLPSLEGSSELADRFLREIKVQASLQHPNIATLHSAQRINNQLLMFMEYVEGRTVDEELRAGPIPVARGVDYVEQVLSALTYAHSRGIIHRDIKPANMMVMPNGTVKLMDFGIARVAAETKLTQTGQTMGSFYYMSPEQINGVPLDERADLYSMGITLYEIVTGRVPFSGDSAYSVMAAHLHADPKPPIELDPKLPDLLNEVILMSIAKEPNRRFQSAEAFHNALKNAATELGPIPARAAGPAAKAPQLPIDPNGPTRILGNASVAMTNAMTGVQPNVPPPPTPPPSPTAPVAAAAAVQASMPPMPPPAPGVPAQSTRTSNLGLYVAIGLIVLLSAGGVAAWKGQLFHSSSSQQPAVDTRQDPSNLPSQTAPGAQQPPQAPQAPAQDMQQQPAAASQTPAAPVQASHTPPVQSASPIPPRQVLTRPNTPASPVLDKALNQAQQAVSAAQQAATQAQQAAQASQAAIPQQTIPQQEDLTELRDLYNKLAIRANVLQEGLGRMEAQQRATGVGMRGDMIAARVRMGVNLQLAEGALKAHDGARLKQHLSQAEKDIDKLESFLGR